MLYQQRDHNSCDGIICFRKKRGKSLLKIQIVKAFSCTVVGSAIIDLELLSGSVLKKKKKKKAEQKLVNVSFGIHLYFTTLKYLTQNLGIITSFFMNDGFL